MKSPGIVNCTSESKTGIFKCVTRELTAEGVRGRINCIKNIFNHFCRFLLNLPYFICWFYLLYYTSLYLKIILFDFKKKH